MDVTAPNIGISRQEFFKNLAASRLLSNSDLEKITSGSSDTDVLRLAQELVAAGTLTDYQLDAISQGRQAELVVGNYEILNRLGAGGMGTVFKARHRKMKRVVALKVLAAALSKDAAFVQRFQREIESIARLGHPNVVMAYDADEAEIGHFLVMEFVNGPDLSSLVRKNGPLGVVEAVDCTLQAACGLAYAHAQGIVHRDVKPHNLLRDANGTVKLTDLGLARLSAGTEGASGSALTQAGGILGTVEYMSPEQAVDAATTDHRGDIYSLGATLYFLMTGRSPYMGQTIMAILLQHRDSPVPRLAATQPNVAPELESLFQRMMAKMPAARIQTMAEVVAQLEAIASKLTGGSAISTPTPKLAAPAKVEEATTITAISPEKLKATAVLIVEPSRVQAGIIRKYLEHQGIAVGNAVTTGADAIAAVRAGRIEAIVSALYLADMTGIDLARQVRTEFKENVPGFVLVSTEMDAKDAGTLSQLSRVVLLHKPFTPEQLVQSLGMVVGKSSQTRTGGETIATAKPRVDRGKLRVLIVDDSAVARTCQRQVLRDLGFSQFAEVGDGAQAIAAATREVFDLIVTDYNMPLMDGHALVSYLKNTPATASIPVIMVTTETDPKLLDPVRKLGVTAIINKSFPADVVRQTVDSLF
jgi:serine/threonine protein kinase/DNA-binding response OmpR family regulator